MTTPPGDPEPTGRVVYISGPITGIEDLNRPAFKAAHDALAAAGYTPVNPHGDMAGRHPMTHAYTVLCPFCELPTDTTDFTHVCNDCNVARDHEPQATWTTIGLPCAKGFPDCAKGDGHAEGCVGV